jgi:hypothetical protein
VAADRTFFSLVDDSLHRFYCVLEDENDGAEELTL